MPLVRSRIQLGDEATDGAEDSVRELGPDERLWLFVVDLQIAADRSLKVFGASVRAALDVALCDQRKESLDQLDPRRRGWGEMQVVARPLGKPRAHLFGLVRAVVVQDEVYILVLRYVCIDGVEQAQELRAAMPSLQLSDHLARGYVPGGEQRGRAVSLVIGACA